MRSSTCECVIFQLQDRFLFHQRLSSSDVFLCTDKLSQERVVVKFQPWDDEPTKYPLESSNLESNNTSQNDTSIDQKPSMKTPCMGEHTRKISMDKNKSNNGDESSDSSMSKKSDKKSDKQSLGTNKIKVIGPEGINLSEKVSVTCRKSCKELMFLKKLEGIPHVQRLLGTVCLDEVCVIITEYVNQKNSFIESVYDVRTRQICDKIQQYMIQLLNTVAKCHEANILIRDVKPSNLLWTDDKGGHLTLIDFDCATILRPNGHNTDVGTNGFKAPEVMAHAQRDSPILQPPTYGTQADVYSCGMALGCLIFQTSESEVDDQTCRKWRRFIRLHHNVPRHLDVLYRVFYDMTRSNPSERFTIEQSLAYLHTPLDVLRENMSRKRVYRTMSRKRHDAYPSTPT